MGTQVVTRTAVIDYTVTKQRVNKNIEGDKATLTFTSLPEARRHARMLMQLGNFKSLKNSNGVTLPI